MKPDRSPAAIPARPPRRATAELTEPNWDHTAGPAQVALSEIVQDTRLQVRQGGLNRTTVELYRRAVRNAQSGADPLPPITLARLDGVLFLVDGFHRFKAHELEQMAFIAASIVVVQSFEQAQWEAGKHNLRHGLPLKAAERRAVFKLFMVAGEFRRADPGASAKQKEQRRSPNVMTLAEIAGAIGMSREGVRKRMKAEFPSVFRVHYNREVERDGQSFAGGLTDYAAFDPNEPTAIVRAAFVNLGAMLPQITKANDRRAFAAGLKRIVKAYEARHGGLPEGDLMVPAGYAHTSLEDASDF